MQPSTTATLKVRQTHSLCPASSAASAGLPADDALRTSSATSQDIKAFPHTEEETCRTGHPPEDSVITASDRQIAITVERGFDYAHLDESSFSRRAMSLHGDEWDSRLKGIVMIQSILTAIQWLDNYTYLAAPACIVFKRLSLEQHRRSHGDSV